MSKSAYLCAGTAFAIFLVPYVQPVTAGAGWWLLAYLLAALGSLLPDIEFLNPLHRRRLEDPMFHMRDVYFGLVTAAIVVKVTEWVLTIYWRPIRLRLIIQIIAVVLFVQLCKYAKKEYRISEGVTTALKIDYILVTILLVVLIFTGKPITRLFLGEEVSEEILTASFEYLISLGIGLYFMSINHSVGGMLRGIQKMIPFLISFVINIFVRIISAYILFHAFWRIGVFIANPVSFMAGSIVALYFYKKLYYDKYIRRNRYEEGSYYKCNEA